MRQGSLSYQRRALLASELLSPATLLATYHQGDQNTQRPYLVENKFLKLSLSLHAGIIINAPSTYAEDNLSKMAEPFGIVSGTVGIASAFTACVDCFEYIQLGRHF